MWEPITYFTALVLFSFVIFATARVRHETLILACIPPMVVAVTVGFVMLIYAGDTFGWLAMIPALVLPLPVAWRLGPVCSTRDLLIAIYLAWALGMVVALVAFSFPDHA